jgi:hypothetical protein
MQNRINSIFTIKDLVNSATPQALKNYKEYTTALKVVEKYSNPIITNGRINHYWFQSLLEILTSGQLIPGGQGNSSPDLYMGTSCIEVKGFNSKELDGLYPIRVGASKFFASNGGIKQLKECDKQLTTMKNIVFTDSYHDDYYMLTETCGLDSVSQIEDIRIIFVSTSKLVNNLLSNVGPHNGNYYHRWIDPDGTERKKKINWPFLEVNTRSLVGGL